MNTEVRRSVVILGAGAIGTLLAYRFARAGHDVTLIARGARLEELRRSGGVLRARRRDRGSVDEIEVAVASELDPVATPDLLLVTVRRQHAETVLDAVAASRARRIMFVFNAAHGLARWRDAVGAERFSWGFPAAIARLEAGVLAYSIVPSWLRAFQITTIGGLADFEVPAVAELTALFTDAGIPCVASVDMKAWLETHAAFMMPVIASGILANASPARRLSWRHAVAAARAMRDAFHRVRSAGSHVTPRALALVSHVPARATAIALWIMFRFARVRVSVGGEHARGEVHAMLDDLTRLAPGGAELDGLRALL